MIFHVVAVTGPEMPGDFGRGPDLGADHPASPGSPGGRAGLASAASFPAAGPRRHVRADAGTPGRVAGNGSVDERLDMDGAGGAKPSKENSNA